MTKEQKICVNCGFCCDGTLFNKAVLQEGEKGTLPEKIKDLYFRTKNKEFFHLPCPYHRGKCTIYYQNKTEICSVYRCRLLYDFNKNKLQFSEAVKIIQQAKILREEVFSLAKDVLNIDCNLPLKEVQKKMHEENHHDINSISSFKYNVLMSKCLILEILLIKYFKPKKDFMAMILSTEFDEAEMIKQIN